MTTIAIDLTSLDDNFSGIEHYALYITKELIKFDDFSFDLIFKNKVSRIEDEFLRQKNVKIQIVSGNRWKVLLLSLPKLIDELKPDYALFLAFPPSLFWKPNKKTKIISTIHDLVAFDVPQTMSFRSRLFFRISTKHDLKISEKIITISEFSKKRIMDFLHVKEERIITAYCSSAMPINHVDFTIIQSKYCIPAKYFLALSTLEPRKNFKKLIEWMNRIWKIHPDYPDLVLAGRKGWKVDDILKDLSSDFINKIHFTGYVDENDISSIYENAECFIFPSIYEGFGIPILEAIQSNCVPLCSDIPTSKEILGEKYPFLFKLSDFHGFSNQIRSIMAINDPSLFLKPYKERVHCYTWGKSADVIMQIFSRE